MDEQTPNRKQQVIIIEQNSTPRRRTSEARGMIYQLIARFRRDAEQSDDARTRTIFQVATEVLSGLAMAFRQHEAHLAEDEEPVLKQEPSDTSPES